MKKAVITGASAGMGREFARILSEMGYATILIARRREKLEQTAKLCKTECEIIEADLSSTDEVLALYERLRSDRDICVLINNAGFGLFGNFTDTDLSKELEMIDVNIKALHILTKLFLRDFVDRNSGYILNVASSASFLPGPLMSTYYATKAYVTRLTLAISQELKHNGSNVYIGAFCPGPVDTEFNDVANVRFSVGGISSTRAAEYAVKKMFARKLISIPGFIIKLGVFFTRFVPTKPLLSVSYNIQHKKS